MSNYRGMNGLIAVAGIAAAVLLAGPLESWAQKRSQEVTVYGKDQAAPAGAVWTDTQTAQSRPKLDRADAPSGKPAAVPGVRQSEKMERPESEWGEAKAQGSGWGKIFWIILGLAAIGAIAG